MRVVIIEENKIASNNYKSLLFNNFSAIEIVGEASTVKASIGILKSTPVDLVLMSVKLTGGNAFQVLQACSPYTFQLIFITTKKQYALKAIKYNAIDYILKPINEYEFCDAINKVIAKKKIKGQVQTTQHSKALYASQNPTHKIILPTVDSIHFVELNDINYCKSNNNNTTFFIKGQDPIIVSQNIKEFSERLLKNKFICPHPSYLVNSDSITRIDKTDKAYIILHNKVRIPISEHQSHSMIDKLKKLIE